MRFTHRTAQYGTNRQAGFTLLEIVIAIAIVAILGALAVFGYMEYTARAKGAEMTLKYDAIRTSAAIRGIDAAKEGCGALAAHYGRLNLADSYAVLDYGFEAVPGGHRPVLTVCSTADRHGTFGVKVARGVHDNLARNNVVEKGALLTDSVVSFGLRLSETVGAVCNGYKPKRVAVCGDTGAAAIAPRCTVSVPHQVDRNVMTFGSELTGYVMNNGDLDTGGDMREFTAEIAIVGGAQITSAGWHGATLLSYASRADSNEFLIWDPASLIIQIQNTELRTGINVNDGQQHRLTVTWQSATGAVLLYDNGKEVWRGTFNQGGVLHGNGKLVLGQDQDSYGGGFSKNDAYQGKIMTASLANVVVPPSAVAGGPIQTDLTGANGLITSVVLGPDGRPIDTTGKHTFTAGGSVSPTLQKVDTGLYVTKDCQ